MAYRTVVGIVGVLILLAGAVFALQGANVIGGSSFMNGSSTWIYAGLLIAIVGALIAFAGYASGRGSPAPNVGRSP